MFSASAEVGKGREGREHSCAEGDAFFLSPFASTSRLLAVAKILLRPGLLFFFRVSLFSILARGRALVLASLLDFFFFSSLLPGFVAYAANGFGK